MKKIALLLLFCGLLVAKEPWVEVDLSSVNLFKINASEYTMRGEIEYVEFRNKLFNKKTNKPVTNKYEIYYKIAKRKLSSYPRGVVQKFRRLGFQKNKLSVATSPFSPKYYFRANGFIISKNNKMWIINEPKDVAWVFNGIDTFAEFVSYLFITNQEFYSYLNRKDKIIYRKVANGYEYKVYDHTKVIIDYKKSIVYNINNLTIYHLRKNGKITSRKGEALVKEIPFKKGEKPVRMDNIHPDPIWAFKSDEEMIKDYLKSKDLITP